ncbi:MAG: GntR family transcriptional regulator [Bacteroidales bacterium]|nr:GntR family transcriptional regulator [Bacteroidales bacterium]
MSEIGKINNLQIIKELDFGIYLDGKEFGEILLPKRYVPENYKIDDFIDVFIYRDSEERLIATTEKPYAMVGDFAFLKVLTINEIGAFLDWGLTKDLFVPFREQKQKMQKGNFYLVFVYLDNESNRIAASSRLDKFLNKTPADYQINQEVDLIIRNKTDMGYKVIINNSHSGVLYKNEVFQTLKEGQKIKGFIKKIREDEKIDVSLQKSGYEKVEKLTEKIINKLKENNGFISVTDKTSPEIIYNTFGVSKKTYKKSIGVLYKKRIINIEKDGIKLNN